MTDYNTILGLGVDFHYKGKDYRIADDLEFGVSAAFERWLKKKAIQTVQEATDDPNELESLRDKFFRAAVAGEYRMEGELARQTIIKNPDAAVELLFLLLEDGKRKNDNQPPVSRSLAKEMLIDEKAGPWVMALCLVALGLDPTSALVLGMGLVMTRAEQKNNQRSTPNVQTLRQELIQRKSLENSSGNALDYLLNYLDSPGEK